MTTHLGFIRRAASRSIAQLDEELHTNKNFQNDGPHIVDLRRKDKVVHDNEITITRIYVSSHDSNGLVNVGWVSNKGLNFCQLCQANFGILTGRHHCRACGNLVCQHCSPYKTLLCGFEELGPLRTCTKCSTTDTVGPTALRFSESFGESMHHETARLEKLAGGTESQDSPSIRSPSVSVPVSHVAERISGYSAANSTTNRESLAKPPTPPPAAPVIDPFEVIVVNEPIYGFVIKSKIMTGSKSKVFINVFYHTCVEDNELSLFQEPTVVPVGDVKTGMQPAHNSEIVPNILLACEKVVTVDKEGVSSDLYNVVVNSEYFSESSIAAAVKITDAVCIQKILRVINKHYNVGVNEDSFIFPKMKQGAVKGDNVLTLRCHRNTHLVDTQKTVITRNDSFVSTSTAATNATGTTTGTSSNHSSRRFTLGPSFSTSNLSNQSESQRRTQRLSLFSTNKVKNDSRTNSPNGFEGSEGDTTPRRFSLFPSASTTNFDRSAAVLSPNMMVKVESQNISDAEAIKLKQDACEDARLLLGWQIYVPSSNDVEAGKIFVITDMAKNSLRKTEYRLSTLHQDDLWAKLKRSDAKSGLEFIPFRKVLFLDGKLQLEVETN